MFFAPLVPGLAISVRYCPPHGGGDPSLMWNIDHAEHGSPPSRGGQDKGSYLQCEAIEREKSPIQALLSLTSIQSDYMIVTAFQVTMVGFAQAFLRKDAVIRRPVCHCPRPMYKMQ